MNFKPLIIAVLALTVLLGFALMADNNNQSARHTEVDFTISCKECHSETTPDVYEAWKSSKHGLMNFGCYMCHGDGQEEFSPKPGSGTCVGCHSPQDTDFSKLSVKNCFDCHDGHTLKFHKLN